MNKRKCKISMNKYSSNRKKGKLHVVLGQSCVLYLFPIPRT